MYLIEIFYLNFLSIVYFINKYRLLFDKCYHITIRLVFQAFFVNSENRLGPVMRFYRCFCIYYRYFLKFFFKQIFLPLPTRTTAITATLE